MRPGGRYARTSYRDSRPGRHATRAAVRADAITDYDTVTAASEPPSIWDLCTCLGEGGCIGCDPDYLDKCAAAAAKQYAPVQGEPDER